ncbi:hypothetical protein BJX99DRAFT_227043 [Aspergillus californicus]
MVSSCGSGSTDCHFLCPSGGTWYVCETAPYFVGCCSSDPCSSNTDNPCPDVYAASYNASAFDGTIFDQIRPNNCLATSGNSSNWYTCNSTSPPFLGCCSSNPCSQTDGCPADDVIPAAWSSSRSGQYELFLDEGTGDGDESGDGGSDGLSAGAIAGIAVGGAAAVVIILAVLFFLRRRRQKATVTPAEQQNMFAGDWAYHHPSSPYQDSHTSSPQPSTAKYPSGFSAAGSSLPSSPPLSSVGGQRPISEMYSEVSSEDHLHPSRGLHISGAGPQTIPELPSEEAAPKKPVIHELGG